jgi:LPXTG-site transpeptidase (sortase) family protein
MRRALPVIAGLLLVTVGLGLWLGSAGPAPAAVASPTPVASRPAAPTPATSAVTVTPDQRSPIADGYRVQIPRLAIDLPIAEGDIVRDIDQQRTPENYAFHLTGTGVPGRGSNSYFYAHARTGMFLALWKARDGDEVFISTPDGKALKYVVSEVHPTVVPTDVSWAQPTGSERLTLQTSTGPNPTDPRFVVVALPAP